MTGDPLSPPLPEAVRALERIVPSDLEAEETWHRNAEYVRLDDVLALVEAAAQQLSLLRGAMAAQDEREAKAGERCGVSARVHGCDWPDAVADAVIASRQRVRELEAAAQQERARLLTIAGLVNGYHNDGTHLSAAETLRAIADALGPAMDPPPTSARDLQAEGDELFGEAHPPPTPEDR